MKCAKTIDLDMLAAICLPHAVDGHSVVAVRGVHYDATLQFGEIIKLFHLLNVIKLQQQTRDKRNVLTGHMQKV